MNITGKTLHTLEFDKILEMLADCAMTEGAKEQALLLTPSDDPETVEKRLRRTSDARRLADAKGTPSFGMVTDVSAACERADKGAALTPKELLAVAAVFRTARGLLDYGKVNRTFASSLDEIFDRLIPNRYLEDRITRSILAEDMIADEASTTLADIRRKIRAENSHIKDSLQKYVTSGAYSKYLQENIVTTRDGRYVIPVKAEHRNEVKGLVHDTSSTGATLFIEPLAVVEANNRLRELGAKEAHEIERILHEISAEVSVHSGELLLDYHNITELALIFAKAELSSRMKATEPVLSDDRSVCLHKARHPLIDRNKVVPVDVAIGGDYDTLVITGPNTGGKTVTLKTLGLFALMTQAGLHIPAEEPSSLCIFDDVLADIGDEQSIEQSLSTFSSHMTNIVSLLDRVNARSLVLFDELGGGTDPVEGAALAVSIIEAVREKGAMCAATTHYAELKEYALDTEGVCNASCEFDVETLRPTYRLIIGTPGKSNAFAISERLGLPAAIVERARGYVSGDSKRFERVIEQLEAMRLEMDRDKQAAEKSHAEFERYRADAEKTLAKRLRDSETELEKAKQKAASMVESARISSDYILAEMDKVRKAKESERLAETIAQARKNVRDHIRANEDSFNPVEEAENDEEYVLPRPLVKGDEVYMTDVRKQATVLAPADKNDWVQVQVGSFKTRTKLKNLKLVEKKPQKPKEKPKPVKGAGYHVEMDRSFSNEIDLRGLTGDEAWQRVDKYLDDAVMSGLSEVRLIHGKGTGALKNALWLYLKGDRRISSYRLGRYGEGDGGVTVVTMK